MKRKTHKDIIKGWYPFSPEEIETYVSRGIWRNLTFGDILDRNVASIPDKVAVIDDTREVTWRELGKKVDRLALHFKKLGLEYGDFVVLITPNVVEFFYIVFGLARLGVVPVMCLPRHRKREVSHMVALHEAKAIIVPTGERFDFVDMVNEFRSEAPFLKFFFTVGGDGIEDWLSVEELLKQEIEKDYPRDYLDQFKPEPSDLVIEQLSGGTTGLPKGIPRTHHEYLCLWEYIGRRAGMTDECVFLTVTPVAHNMPFSAVWGPMFYRGGTTVITKFPRPEDSFRLIEKYRITHVELVPVVVTYWMEAEEIRRKYDLSSLKVIGCGAQKVKPELVKWCMEELGVNFTNTFGMTEGPHIATRWHSPMEAQFNTVGRPAILDDSVVVKLVDSDNKEVKPGEVGELVIKGPMTFKGYFRVPEENAKVFDEQGFFHTGDLMSLRPDGRYVVEGRKKDTVIRGGENVFPEPVEGWLMKHPKVVNTAVVGMPDAKLGEKLCAFVQTAEGKNLTFEEVKEFMKEEGIAVFQWPERLEVVPGWPLTALNKIDKRLLRAYITNRLLEEGTISDELGDEFLRKDKITLDDMQTGRVKIDFTGSLE
ncbi:MAG: AMP-binding protein [Deltaproteobacteria bacterium]|nr:MAG: AMP-binding protein [Deltaproteobacteria bacterium]